MQPIGDETECNILGKGRELVATVSDNDARLIAAAPEMLDRLIKLTSILSNLDDWHQMGKVVPRETWGEVNDFIEEGRQTIRKATGG